MGIAVLGLLALVVIALVNAIVAMQTAKRALLRSGKAIRIARGSVDGEAEQAEGARLERGHPYREATQVATEEPSLRELEQWLSRVALVADEAKNEAIVAMDKARAAYHRAESVTTVRVCPRCGGQLGVPRTCQGGTPCGGFRAIYGPDIGSPPDRGKLHVHETCNGCGEWVRREGWD